MKIMNNHHFSEKASCPNYRAYPFFIELRKYLNRRDVRRISDLKLDVFNGQYVRILKPKPIVWRWMKEVDMKFVSSKGRVRLYAMDEASLIMFKLAFL